MVSQYLVALFDAQEIPLRGRSMHAIPDRSFFDEKPVQMVVFRVGHDEPVGHETKLTRNFVGTSGGTAGRRGLVSEES